jgi:hypothetical protein
MSSKPTGFRAGVEVGEGCQKMTTVTVAGPSAALGLTRGGAPRAALGFQLTLDRNHEY